MIRVGIIGLGKMGLSHLAIARMHPEVDIAGVCDSNSYVTDTLAKFTGLRGYSRIADLLKNEALDAAIVATPSRSHAAICEELLQRGAHVFCEKPFVLDPADGEKIVELAERAGLVNQVGYHYRFVAAFEQAARITASGALGRIHHVRVEAYGPVVLRQKGRTWRSAKDEGGGALYDYACHALDLVNYIVGPPSEVDGVVLNRVFSRDVEDEVYGSLRFASGATGQLAVNWSDESFRKMSMKISVWGENGRVIADRQECEVYLRSTSTMLPNHSAGWTVRNTTDLTQPVQYYLRGEEYSAQIDHFIESIKSGRTNGTNSFRSALQTDRVVAMMAQAQGSGGVRGNNASEQPRRLLSALLPRRERNRS